MKLDRNENEDGTGKYALILMRKIPPMHPQIRRRIYDALDTLRELGVLDMGYEGTDGEFFVLKLRDECAPSALRAYAHEAAKFDPEYATEITILADRAANHPRQKQPD